MMSDGNYLHFFIIFGNTAVSFLFFLLNRNLTIRLVHGHFFPDKMQKLNDFHCMQVFALAE